MGRGGDTIGTRQRGTEYERVCAARHLCVHYTIDVIALVAEKHEGNLFGCLNSSLSSTHERSGRAVGVLAEKLHEQNSTEEIRATQISMCDTYA